MSLTRRRKGNHSSNIAPSDAALADADRIQGTATFGPELAGVSADEGELLDISGGETLSEVLCLYS
jgi:hypothetical protein